MRLPLRIVFVLVTATAIAVGVACDDEGASRHLGFAGDGGAAPVSPGEPAGDAQTDAPMSTMRFAHLAPGVAPVDFCYRPASSGTFVGPVLGGPASPSADAGAPDDADAAPAPAPILDASTFDSGPSTDAGEDRLRSASYRTVSKYLNLQGSGPITIAIVEAGATSCANALATGEVTLDPGKLSTVVLFGRRGDGGMDLEVGAFTDDRATEADKLRVRIVHAALGTTTVPGVGPIAVRAVGAQTTVLADRVEPRRASTPSQAVTVDNLGYVIAPPMAPPVSLAIGPGSTDGADAGFPPWQSQARDLDLRGGSLHTGFVLSSPGPSEATFEVLWCADSTTSGDQTKCELVP